MVALTHGVRLVVMMAYGDEQDETLIIRWNF